MKKLSFLVVLFLCFWILQPSYAQETKKKSTTTKKSAKKSTKTTKKSTKKSTATKDSTQTKTETKSKTGTRQIVLTSKESKFKLTIYGNRDGDKFSAVGKVNMGWDVSVKCVKKTAKGESWYKPNCLSYFFFGMDAVYHYSIIFFNDGSIKLLQTKKGDHQPFDTFYGTYE